MIKLKCKRCNGEGYVPNPDFEACRSPDVRAEIGLYQEGDCEHCPEYLHDSCQEGEYVKCPNCNGNGFMEIDEDLWDISPLVEAKT